MHAVARSLRSIAAGSLLASAAYACVGSDPPPTYSSPPGPSANPATGDAGTDTADAAAEGAVAHAECHWDDPFEAPVPLGGDVNTDTTEQFGATLTADETQIFFIADGTRAGGADALQYQVFSATRKSKDDDFVGSARIVSLLDPSRRRDVGVAVSPAGTLLVLSSEPSGATSPNLYDLYVTSRASGHDFGIPARAADPSSNGYDKTPFVTADGASLLLATSRGKASPADLDLYIAPKKSGQLDFGPPSLLGGGNTFATGDAESSPVLSADGLTVYFARQPLSPPGQPTRIWRSHRASTKDLFLPPTVVDELEAASDAGATYDAPSWISPDDCRLYIATNRRVRDAGPARLDIYLAQRQPRAR